MKRAKQRKRHYPYKWSGNWSYLDRDVYGEFVRPESYQGNPLVTGEIGTFEGVRIIHSEREKKVQVRKGKRHGK